MRVGKIIGVVLVVLVLAIGGLVVYLLNLDFNQYKPEIAQAAKSATGRDLSINGDLSLALSLNPSIVVEGVTLANAQWGSKPQMLTVKRFEGQVGLLDVLSGNFQVQKLVLIEPTILLETDASGRGNWVFDGVPAAGGSSGSASGVGAPAVSISNVRIENARIEYHDGVTGQSTVLSINTIEATSGGDGFDQPITLAISAALNAVAVEANGSVGPIADLLAGRPYPIDFKMRTAGAEASVTGRIERPLAGDGIALDVTLRSDDSSKLSGLTGTSVPAIGNLQLSAKVGRDGDKYSVTDLAAAVAGVTLAGNLEADLSGDRPSVAGALHSPRLDLDALFPPQEKQKTARLFPADPLPSEALHAANVDLTLSVDSALVRGIELGASRFEVTLDRGALAISPQIALGDGAISGDITARAPASANSAIALKVDLKGKAIDAGALVNQVGGQALLTGGATNLRIKLSGKGRSVRQIMAGLNGRLRAKVGSGKLHNSALDKVGGDLLVQMLSLLNPGAKEQDHTVLDCAAVLFKIDDGIATADQGIAIETETFTVVGSGTVDLGTEALDLGLRPEAREGLGLSVGSLAGLVRIGGTLAEPKPTADAAGVLSAGAQAGAAVATGGLSILAKGLFDQVTADPNPCATALGKKRKKTKSAKKESGSLTETITDTTKQVTEGVGEVLEGLFGN